MPINNDSFHLKETLMPKLLKSTCTKLSCLSTCKKLMSSLTSFLRYCEDIANLLFQELWECLSISIKSYIINLQHNFMLIYMLKINFITHFSLKILQKNSKLVILGKLGMSGHTHLNYTINWKKPWTFICRQKTNFILHVFLEILQRYCKLVILVTLGMSGRTPKVVPSTSRIFLCLFAGKQFLEILQRHANFSFWVFQACLAIHTQNL